MFDIKCSLLRSSNAHTYKILNFSFAFVSYFPLETRLIYSNNFYNAEYSKFLLLIKNSAKLAKRVREIMRIVNIGARVDIFTLIKFRITRLDRLYEQL